MSDAKHDQEFEDFLQGKDNLSQLLKDMPQPDSPKHLNQKILADVEAKLSPPPRPASRPSWLVFAQWAVPVCMVCVVGTVVIYQYYAQPVRGQTAALAQELAGEDGNQMPKSKTSKATDLKNYVSDNNTDNHEGGYGGSYGGGHDASRKAYQPEQDKLKHIEQLLDQQKNAEAKAEWRQFKQQYPYYVVDKELHKRLEKL